MSLAHKATVGVAVLMCVANGAGIYTGFEYDSKFLRNLCLLLAPVYLALVVSLLREKK